MIVSVIAGVDLAALGNGNVTALRTAIGDAWSKATPVIL